MRFFRRRGKPTATPDPGASVAHHNVYGAPGFETTVRVEFSPENRARFTGINRPEVSTTPALSFTVEQTARLLLGYAARDMDDKWTVFAEDTSDGASVFFVRSWIGAIIFRLDVAIVHGAATATALTWETDPAVLTAGDYEFATRTIVEICHWMLRMDPPPVLSQAGPG